MRIIKNNLFKIIFAGLLIRLIAMLIPGTHQTDIISFKGWAESVYTLGTSRFYVTGGFKDYPPGYMYVLYVMGFLRNLFRLNFDGFAYTFLLKLPSILADVGTGVLIYFIAKRRTSEKAACIISLIYVLNPTVFLISSVWGQVDAIHTLAVVASIFFLTEKKMLPSFLLFAVSFVIKPQAFMFTPIYMFFVWDYLKEQQFEAKAFVLLAQYAGLSLICVFALLAPFTQFRNGFFDFVPIVKLYKSTLAFYPYTTVNAYNVWALFGLNWVPISQTFLNVTYNAWGTIALVITVLFSFHLLNKNKSASNYFFVAAIINLCTFMFSVKMHERYGFPALALLLVAYAYSGNKKIKWIYFGFSLTFLINYLDVMRANLADFNWDLLKTTAIYFSVPMLIVFVYAIYTAVKMYPNENKRYTFQIDKTEEPPRYGKMDFIALGAIMLVYSIFAFVNLGNLHSPQTMWEAEGGDFIVVDFGQAQDISRMQFFLGPKHEKQFSVALSQDGDDWFGEKEIEVYSVFRWGEEQIENSARYVRIFANSNEFYMAEMAFRNNEDEIIPIMSVDEQAAALFDEQAFVPKREDYLNGTYFDEIYHARTGYEYVHGSVIYENTHPPLGKLIISLGIRMFGMTPFGWRFFGAFFGVLMIPFIFAFSKRMFKDTIWACFTTVLFTFDFMHFAQTRIATIDTYIVFFVIAMYFFMYKYYTMSFYDAKLWKTLVPLFLSGVFMGLGVASKWPGVYAGIGLAILFFITMAKRYMEYRYAKKENLGGNYKHFYKYAAITLACCVLFFVIVPLVIYVLSYIPFYYKTENFYFTRESFEFLTKYPALIKIFPDNDFGNFICSVIQGQINMFDYHSNVFDSHPYSSVWWQWPLDVRPIFYFAYTISKNVRQGISSFGNPVVWWGGLLSLFWCINKFYKKHDKTILFLLIAFFAQFVPWIFIPRTTFIYHYFPCVAFLTLLFTYTFKNSKLGEKRRNIIGIMVAVFVLFVMFYPILSGMPINIKYVNDFLKLPFMKRWQLI